mmetsp:Transcript_24915/g.41662  ORF Transcript_24915/g.41662 Transcript_24915/m.41662 type:complete len:249 (-) Transcript_24915:283-1029(-)
MPLQLHLLPGPQLTYQNVIKYHLYPAIRRALLVHEGGELCFAILGELAARRQPLQHTRGDRAVHHFPIFPHTLHLELEHDGVAFVGNVLRGAVLEVRGVHFDGHQPEPVCQHLVLHDGGIVGNEHLLDGHCGHLTDEDAPQSVRDGRVYADQLHLQHLVGQRNDVRLEVFLKPLKVQRIVDVQGSVGAGVLRTYAMVGLVVAAEDARALFLEVLREPHRDVWHVQRRLWFLFLILLLLLGLWRHGTGG